MYICVIIVIVTESQYDISIIFDNEIKKKKEVLKWN